MTQIQCENISLAYDGIVVAREINFSLHAGEYLCIVGENGSGKSTLIKGLLGLMPPHSGRIVFGDGLTHREIGYLPQQSDVQKDFPASVREIVLSGCIERGGRSLFYSRAQRQNAAAAMEKLGITDIASACYRELSGGQQQRVRLARALCAANRMLLLDEPTTGLDPVVSAEFYAIIERLNREDGITVIMVSHDTGVPLRHATHVLHLKQKPLFFGTKDAYLQSDAGKNFLGGCADGDVS
ncbi:MAG: ABC transporter ATP-binding protein [Ruminococcaceae bacterium]|nr:ABC transporter ATP-binding protein [Oscillospiraceae bacterium]